MSAHADELALADEIAAWLQGHVDEAGVDGVVVGLSGGIDSAVVCGLCRRALGPDRVLAIIMPANSRPQDGEDARLVADHFGVDARTIDLTPIVETFLAAMPGRAGNDDRHAGEWRPEGRAQLAVANVKPRLRMATLYYVANLRNALVVGTGNKSEAMIGYFTKYGDGGVDLLPLADLYKHEVRALARAIGVPQRIIDRPPSAGLWQGQTDEGEIGLSYDELDRTLAAIESGTTEGVPPEQLERVRRMIATSEHKRRPIPIFRRSAPGSILGDGSSDGR